jgi:hypothetical protein
MSQDALKSSPVGFAAVGTSTCEHNENSILPGVPCAWRVGFLFAWQGFVVVLFRAFCFIYYICIIHLYNIYPLSQGRQAPPTRLTVDSRRRHTLARWSMSLPLKNFSSQDKVAFCASPALSASAASRSPHADIAFQLCCRALSVP